MARKIDSLSLRVDSCLSGISGLQTTMTSVPDPMHWLSSSSAARSCGEPQLAALGSPALEVLEKCQGKVPETSVPVLGEAPPASGPCRGDCPPEDSDPASPKPEDCDPHLRRSGSKTSSWSLGWLQVRDRPQRGKWAETIWKFLEEPESSQAARWFAAVWVPFIFASVICTLLQSVKPPPLEGRTAGVLELVFDAIFTVEVVLRIFVAPSFSVFLLSAHNIFDVLAALPLVFRLAVGLDAAPSPGTEAEDVAAEVALALVCISPVLRLLKTLRRFQQFHIFMAVLSFTSEALKFLMLTLVLIVLSFSSLIYLVEPRSNIETLPKAMWLTVVTITTVGYGDVTPENNIGHAIVAVLLVVSVFVMAMLIGIIGNAFTETWKDRDRILLNRRFHDRMVQCGYTAQDIAGMFRQYDSDRNGELSLSEFVAMVADMQLCLQEQRAVQLFESIDKDGSGSIDAREFVREFFPTRFNEIYGRRESKEDGQRMLGLHGSSQRSLPTCNDPTYPSSASERAARQPAEAR